MIVACPSCQTRFQLDPVKLQPVGRHVRCAKCSHRWLQLPEGMELPAGLMPPESAAPETQPPAPEPAAAESPAPSPEPSPEPTPEPTPEPSPAEPTAEPAIAAPPGTPAESPAEVAKSLAAIAEQVAAAGAGAAGEAGGPAQRLGARMTGPIIVPPRLKPAKKAKRSSGLVFLLAAIAIVAVIAAAAYFFRDTIARVIPGAETIYSLLHISTDNPAEDLEISIDKVDAQDDGGKRFFSVTATIFNQSEHPVAIPPLVIVPVDEAGNQLEPIRFRLSERVAEPGQNIKFQKSFDDWPIAAKSFVLSVGDPH